MAGATGRAGSGPPGGLLRWVVYRTLACLESRRGVTRQPLAVSRRVSHILVGGGFMRARLLCLLTAIIGLAVLPGRATGQQPVTVTGRVMSAAGIPLVFVDVRIPELALGALTRDNGVYTIVVPGARVSNQQVTVVARVLGYKSQSLKVTLSGGTVTQDLTLAPNPLQLGEVVVTGAGTTSASEKLGHVRNQVDSTLIQR